MASDLYFILNPSLGIIKIGIAEDVEARRRTLECGCGVPLEILKVVAAAERHEKPLHAALHASRLLGEWFAPTDDLFGLIEGTEDIPAFLKRMAPQVAAWEERAFVAQTEERAAIEREREELRAARAKLRAEEKRIRDEAAAKAAKRRLQREERERRKAEKLQLEAEQARAAAVAGIPVLNPIAAARASERRSLVVAQRAKNAAMIGRTPIHYETQRGATMSASKGN